MRHEPRAIDERAGVHFHLVGQESLVAYKCAEIGGIAARRGSKQVRHEMRVRFKAEKAAERECLRDLFGRGMAPVRFEHMLVEALHAHLDFGTAERAHKGERLAIDGVGARLDDEAHVAVRGVHVALMFAENVAERGVLHGRYMLPSVIFAVEFTNRLGVRFFALVYALLSFCACSSKRFGVMRNACLVVERATLGFVLVGEVERRHASAARIGGCAVVVAIVASAVAVVS